MKPFVIGIAGGSGSGKTTIVQEIIDTLGPENIAWIRHDDYYKNQDHMAMSERIKVNYDHPDSLDNNLLYEQVTQLINGHSIEKPTYDFVNHTRSSETEIVEPKKIIVIEGILTLESKKLRKLYDLKLYVECDLDTMFIRRLIRDTSERGRTMDSVVNQYRKTVKPMFYQYVKPSKRRANILIPNNDKDKHSIAVDVIVSKINAIINA